MRRSSAFATSALFVVTFAASCAGDDADGRRLALPAATSESAGDGRRYEIVGLARLSRAAPSATLALAADATAEGGILVGLKNVDAEAAARGAAARLVDGVPAAFAAVRVVDAEGAPIPGAVATVDADGRGVRATGLALAPGAWIHLRILLAHALPAGAGVATTADY